MGSMSEYAEPIKHTLNMPATIKTGRNLQVDQERWVLLHQRLVQFIALGVNAIGIANDTLANACSPDEKKTTNSNVTASARIKRMLMSSLRIASIVYELSPLESLILPQPFTSDKCHGSCPSIQLIIICYT